MKTHLVRSPFNCVNVAAVFAPEKIYGCSGAEAFNCLPKFQFAAATLTGLTRLTGGRLHGVFHGEGEALRWQRDLAPSRRGICLLSDAKSCLFRQAGDNNVVGPALGQKQTLQQVGGSLLYPQQRTCAVQLGMSAKCQ